MTIERPTNEAIAEALEQLAHRLAEREANPHRVQAYRTAAETTREAKRPLADLLEQGGTEALKELPGIGESLDSRIAGFVETGRLLLLEQINASFSPQRLFMRVSGMGRSGLMRHSHESGLKHLLLQLAQILESFFS